MRTALTAMLTGLAAALVMGAGLASAQSLSARVGYVEAAPIFIEGPEGELDGFGAELFRRIAAREALELDFVRYGSTAELFEAFRAGDVELFTSVRPPPELAAGAAISPAVAAVAARLFVRANDPDDSDDAVIEGMRIGYLSGARGAYVDALEPSNELVPARGLPSLFFDLLSGVTDAIVMFDDVAFASARRAGVDHRLRPTGPSLFRGERVVMAKPDRPELQSRVQRAVAAMEAEGALQEMRELWLLSPSELIPETLMVGVTHFPPYQVQREDGTFSGFAIEVLREIAARTGLSLEFRAIDASQFTSSIREGVVDLLPQASITDERRQVFDFTVPIDEDSISLFLGGELRGRASTLDDLAGYVVGVTAVNPGRVLAERAAGAELRIADSVDALVVMLASGEVDAAVYSTEPFSQAIEEAGVGGDVFRVEKPLQTTYRGVVLRQGLGQVRESLNAVIPTFLTSSEYQALRQRWFSKPVFWTAERLSWLLAAIAIVLAVGMSIVAVRMFRERRARERMQLIDDVFRSAPLGFALFDREGALRVFNEGFRGMFAAGRDDVGEGLRQEELLREGVRQGLYDLGDESAEAWIERRMALHEGGDTEYDLALTGGRVIRAVNRRTADELVFSVYRDVTEERRHESALDALNRRLSLVLNTSTNGIVALDRHGQIIMINPAARHMLGGVSEEPPFPWPDTIRFLEAQSLAPLDASRDPVHRTLAGQRLSGETNLMTRQNSEVHRYVRISSALVDSADPELRAVVAIDDVTAEEINRQQVERRGRLDALGQLTGGIAHDFNNLLGTILNSVEVVALDRQSDRGRRLLDNAIASVRRGAQLTARLLSFAKQAPGTAESRSVKDIFVNMDALLRPTIEETITLQMEAPDEELPVFCDQPQLENALLNLVLNARDAILRSGKGDSITIAARGVETSADEAAKRRIGSVFVSGAKEDEEAGDNRRGDGRRFRYVEIAVSDNGEGMSEEVKRRAIDPFFTTKGTNSGTGLGLSMVYGFVQQAGGELRIYSELGLGTSVKMLLPRGAMEGRREAPIESTPLTPGGGEAVLVVEDEASLLASLTESLVALGYAPVQAVSGVEALEILESGVHVDLLLTDIVMPGGVGGFELAKRARLMRPDLPIVYMSGYTGFSTEQMTSAVAQMIQKPCSLPELSSALRAALDERR